MDKVATKEPQLMRAHTQSRVTHAVGGTSVGHMHARAHTHTCIRGQLCICRAPNHTTTTAITFPVSTALNQCNHCSVRCRTNKPTSTTRCFQADTCHMHGNQISRNERARKLAKTNRPAIRSSGYKAIQRGRQRHASTHAREMHHYGYR